MRDITAEDFLAILEFRPVEVWTVDSIVIMTDCLPAKEWAVLPENVQREVLNHIYNN